MSPDLADATALQTSQEIGGLIATAQEKLETAKRGLTPGSSTQAWALLSSLSLHLEEIAVIAKGSVDYEDTLSGLVVRRPRRSV